MVIILVKAPCSFFASHMMSNTIDPPSNAMNSSQFQPLVASTIGEAAHRSQRLRSIRKLLHQGSKQKDRQVVYRRAEGCDHSRQSLVEVSDLVEDISRYVQCQRKRASRGPAFG